MCGGVKGEFGCAPDAARCLGAFLMIDRVGVVRPVVSVLEMRLSGVHVLRMTTPS